MASIINLFFIDIQRSMLFLLTCCLLLQLSYSLYEIEVYRMFGYEDEGISHGCKAGSLNIVTSHFNSKNK